MTVGITWHGAIPLGTKATFITRIANFDLDRCPEAAGIYIFARRFGKTLQPIYIGKGANLRRRLKTQFNNLKLIQAIAKEKAGDRVLLLGTIKAQAPGAIRKKLRLAERTHVEHALTAGYPIVNVQLTKGPIDVVSIIGKKAQNHPFPRVMLSKA